MEEPLERLPHALEIMRLSAPSPENPQRKPHERVPVRGRVHRAVLCRDDREDHDGAGECAAGDEPASAMAVVVRRFDDHGGASVDGSLSEVNHARVRRVLLALAMLATAMGSMDGAVEERPEG